MRWGISEFIDEEGHQEGERDHDGQEAGNRTTTGSPCTLRTAAALPRQMPLTIHRSDVIASIENQSLKSPVTASGHSYRLARLVANRDPEAGLERSIGLSPLPTPLTWRLNRLRAAMGST